MCNAIGVDPLAASNAKGKSGKVTGKGSWWAQLRKADDESELHLRLAMRVVEICRASRNENGGLLGVEGCKEKVKKGQGIGGKLDITEYVGCLVMYISDSLKSQKRLSISLSTSDDILRAVGSLKPLGSGFSIVKVGSKQMIRSIPKELSTDQSRVLEAIQVLGYVTVVMLVDNLGWENERAETVLEDLLADSLVWIDLQTEEKEYWAPPTDFSDD